MSRDGSSGGVIRLGIITKDGIVRKNVLGNDLPRFYEKWMNTFDFFIIQQNYKSNKWINEINKMHLYPVF